MLPCLQSLRRLPRRHPKLVVAESWDDNVRAGYAGTVALARVVRVTPDVLPRGVPKVRLRAVSEEPIGPDEGATKDVCGLPVHVAAPHKDDLVAGDIPREVLCVQGGGKAIVRSRFS